MHEFVTTVEYKPFHSLGIDSWNYGKKLVIKTIAEQSIEWRTILINKLKNINSQNEDQRTNNQLFVYVASLTENGRQSLIEVLGI